nr:MAG TPA: tail assembly chaperone protein [Caudoviricetes sp.]
MGTITLGGKEYPILFDFNVVEKIQKRYCAKGGLDAFGDELGMTGELKWVLALLMNEGAEFEAKQTNSKAERYTPDQVGMIMTVADFREGKIGEMLVDAFRESVGDTGNLGAEEMEKIGASMIMEILAKSQRA